MESIETLNQRLIDKYGKYLDGQAMFRIIHSENILEKRLVTHTREGLQLSKPEFAEVPKYRQYINNKYVLEGLKELPEFAEGQLTSRLSYEPIWVFEDGKGNPVPPIWIGIEHILESLRCAVEGENEKIEDPNDALNDPKTMYEAREHKLKEIQEALWPNETEIGDALAYKEAVGFTTSKEFTGDKNVVPRNYTKES